MARTLSGSQTPSISISSYVISMTPSLQRLLLLVILSKSPMIFLLLILLYPQL